MGLGEVVWEEGVVGWNGGRGSDKNEGVRVKCRWFFVGGLGGCIEGLR